MDRCDGEEWSDDEWFCGATQRYVEDKEHSEEALVDKGEQQTELQQQEEPVMEEFTMDDSFDEWIASLEVMMDQDCRNGGDNAKEVEQGVDDEMPCTGSAGEEGENLITADSPQCEGSGLCDDADPEARGTKAEVVGDQGEAHASRDPADESPRPTAAHTGAADNRPISEREVRDINDDEGTDEMRATRDALPPSRSPVMMSRVLEAKMDEGYATRSSVGTKVMKPGSADACTSLPEKNVGARIRGKVRKDDLLDSNRMTGGQEDDEMPGTSQPIAVVKDGGRGDQEPLMDVFGTAPPGGVYTAPSGALPASPASTLYQPASQELRMPSKTQAVQHIDCVTLGIMAGTARIGSGGERVGPRVTNRDECVHTKDGTCHTHGPGAKWRWRPIPPHLRTVGPDGKIKKRVYFWSCEVGTGGRNLRQSRINFGRKEEDNDEYRRDNAGTRDTRTRG